MLVLVAAHIMLGMCCGKSGGPKHVGLSSATTGSSSLRAAGGILNDREQN